MVSLFRLVETHRFTCNLTYLGHHVTLTLGQIFTLTLQGHLIHVVISMSIDKANMMVSKSLLRAFKHESYHRKTVLLKNVIFDLSCPLKPKQVKSEDMLAKERFKSFLVFFF